MSHIAFVRPSLDLSQGVSYNRVAKCVSRLDRILARIDGTVSYPVKTAKGAPRQKQRGDLRVLQPKVSARKLHQEMGFYFDYGFNGGPNDCDGTRVVKTERIIGPPAWQRRAGGSYSRFLGASSVASALGIRSGATPYGHRCQQPHDGTSAANRSGHRSARWSLVDRLR